MSVNFDRIAATYDESRGGLERGAAVAAVIRPHLPADGRVLEIGVGTGLVAVAMDRDVIGVDISKAMLGLARTRLADRLAQADGVALPFPSASFAGGYAVWVLHLMADREAVFAELHRVLRPGAPFVVELTAQFVAEGDAIQAILGTMFDALLGPPSDTADRAIAAATAAGLRMVAVDTRTNTLDESPAKIAASIEARSSSAFWRVTDEQWSAHVAPALDALRALPDQNVRRPRQMVNTTVVLANP